MTYGTGNSGDYKKLKGQTIEVVDTDPVAYVGAWATGGALNTARAQSCICNWSWNTNRSFNSWWL
jgi:hypothetical protein